MYIDPLGTTAIQCGIQNNVVGQDILASWLINGGFTNNLSTYFNVYTSVMGITDENVSGLNLVNPVEMHLFLPKLIMASTNRYQRMNNSYQDGASIGILVRHGTGLTDVLVSMSERIDTINSDISLIYSDRPLSERIMPSIRMGVTAVNTSAFIVGGAYSVKHVLNPKVSVPSSVIIDDLGNIYGSTYSDGTIVLNEGLSYTDELLTLYHEAGHYTLTPKGIIEVPRQNLSQLTYNNSNLFRFTEEAIVEIGAQRMAGTSISGSVQQGIELAVGYLDSNIMLDIILISLLKGIQDLARSDQ